MDRNHIENEVLEYFRALSPECQQTIRLLLKTIKKNTTQSKRVIFLKGLLNRKTCLKPSEI